MINVLKLKVTKVKRLHFEDCTVTISVNNILRNVRMKKEQIIT